MKEHLESLLKAAVQQLQIDGALEDKVVVPQVVLSRNPKNGDYASNIALTLAKSAGLAPMTLAQRIVQALPASGRVRKVEVAPPGFINFFLAGDSFYSVVEEILAQGKHYGENQMGAGQRVHIEFVSANPTGPLHVGHGRGAAYGACIANLLGASGFQVHREYYVNDAGRQIGILALSVWIRYLQHWDASLVLPPQAYQGQYILDIAGDLRKEYDRRFYYASADIEKHLSQSIKADETPEAYLDRWVTAAQTLMGEEDFQLLRERSWHNILDDIKNDLAEFGVLYDEWFLESRLLKSGLIKQGIDLLRKHETVYEKEGALWFRATAFGDEKDRVLIRHNGAPTYFASDVAYHLYKYNAGYDRIINVFGADHHGYVPRIRAVLQGLGKDPHKLQVLLVQFAILYRGQEKVSMSTRGGQFVTLRELREEVGNDAARFFYVMRKPEQHLDFDLDLAKSQSRENPVYYIQYAHARACSVWRQLANQGGQWSQSQGLEHLSLLTTEYEKELLAALAQYPEVIIQAARHDTPHILAHYLQVLANHFHTYYNAEKFLIGEEAHRNARLCLMAAVQQVVFNGLALLGVSAPERM